MLTAFLVLDELESRMPRECHVLVPIVGALTVTLSGLLFCLAWVSITTYIAYYCAYGYLDAMQEAEWVAHQQELTYQDNERLRARIEELEAMIEERRENEVLADLKLNRCEREIERGRDALDRCFENSLTLLRLHYQR